MKLWKLICEGLADFALGYILVWVIALTGALLLFSWLMSVIGPWIPGICMAAIVFVALRAGYRHYQKIEAQKQQQDQPRTYYDEDSGQSYQA